MSIAGGRRQEALPDEAAPRVPGAPKGNHNAWKHGDYTKEMLEMRRKIAALVRASRQTLLEIS